MRNFCKFCSRIGDCKEEGFCVQEPFALEIGPGETVTPGWIHLDIRRMPCIEFVQSAEDLPFNDDTVSHISAKSILEHISYRKTLDVLKEWRRVLIKGGSLILVLPLIDGRFKRYYEGKLRLEGLNDLLGAQDYPANTHLSFFDEEYLGRMLNTAGYESWSITLRISIDKNPDYLDGVEIVAKK